MTIQQTLVLIKPDALQKGITGDIMSILSQVNLKIIGLKITKVSQELAELHYEEHKDKSFFKDLIDFLQGKSHADRVIAIVYQGEDSIKKIRSLAGTAHPEKAEPTSIRGRYGRINSKTQNIENAIHASDSLESAEREIKLWFKSKEITEKIYSDW